MWAEYLLLAILPRPLRDPMPAHFLLGFGRSLRALAVLLSRFCS